MREISSDTTLATGPNSNRLAVFEEQIAGLKNSPHVVTSELPTSQKCDSLQPNILCSNLLSAHQLLSDGDLYHNSHHLITSINQHFLQLGLPQYEEMLETKDDEVPDLQSKAMGIIGVLRIVESNLDKLMSTRKDTAVQQRKHQKHFGILEGSATIDPSTALILQTLSNMESNLLQSTRTFTNFENPSSGDTSMHPSACPSIAGLKPNSQVTFSDTNGGKRFIYQQSEQTRGQDEFSVTPSIENQGISQMKFENEECNFVLWARELEEKAAVMHRELGEITLNCKKKIGRLEQEIARYRQKIVENVGEIERLQCEANEREGILEEMRADYEKEQRLKEEVERASDINMMKMTEQWCSEKNQFIATVEELETRVHNLQNARDLSAVEITHLTASNSSQLNIIEKQKIQLSNSNKRLSELEDTLRNRDSIIIDKHQNIQSLTEKLSTEGERWSTMIRMKDDAIKNVTENAINLTTELEIAKQTLEDRRRELEETLCTTENYKTRIETLEVAVAKRETEVLNLKQELTEVESRLDDEKKLFYKKISESKDELKRGEAEFQSKILQLETTRVELSSHLNDAKQKYDDLTRYCNELETKLRDKTAEFDEYIYAQTQQKIEDAQRAEAHKADLDKRLANALVERDRFKEDQATQSALLLESRSKTETLRLKNESLQAKLCEISNSKLSQENEFRELKEILATREKELCNSEGCLNSLKAEMREMTEAKDVCDMELSEVQSLYHHKIQDLNIANNKLEGLQKEYEELTQERDNLLRQCDQMRTESLETQREFDNRFDKIQANLTQTQAKSDQSNKKIEELEGKLQKNIDISAEMQIAAIESHRQEIQRMMENECKLSKALLKEEEKCTLLDKTLEEKQQMLGLYGDENKRLSSELAQAETQLQKLYDEVRSTESKLGAVTEASAALEVNMKSTQKSFTEERERWNSKEELYIEQLDQLRKEKDNEIVKACDLLKELEQNKSEFKSLKNDAIATAENLALTTEMNERKSAECVEFERHVEKLKQQVLEQTQYIMKLEREHSDLKIGLASSNGNGQGRVEVLEHQKEMVNNLLMQIKTLPGSKSNAKQSLEGRDLYIDELEKYLSRAKSALEFYHETDKPSSYNQTKLTRAPINTSDSDKQDVPTTIFKRRLSNDATTSNRPKRTRERNSPDNFQANTEPEGSSITTPASILPKIKRNEVVIYFSGFKENQEHSIKLKEKLTSMVTKLGGSVITDGSETFDEKITHMITPPNSRTLKTFAAVLTSKWLIQKYSWIIDSYKAGNFLPEDKYGVQYYETPFKNKAFFIAPSFLAENSKKSHRFENCRSLIVDFGQGKITQDVADADYVLRSSSDNCDYNGLPTCTWQTFISMIPGSQILPKK